MEMAQKRNFALFSLCMWAASSTSANICLTPFVHRGVTFKNRVGLAPLTRGRASFPEGVVSDLHVQYYTQRSSGGFILTEATGISRRGLGWYRAPGIYTGEQIEAWKRVTESVHEAGGKIYLQLWHMGRAGHSDVFMHRPLAPSAIALEGEVPAAYHQRKPYETPEAMTHRQIRQAVGEYKQAALNAIAAGFDGCQVHGANGYLIEQFLQPSSNQRRDEYGGSLTNRLRFLKEVLEAVTGAIGPDRFPPSYCAATRCTRCHDMVLRVDAERGSGSAPTAWD